MQLHKTVFGTSGKVDFLGSIVSICDPHFSLLVTILNQAIFSKPCGGPKIGAALHTRQYQKGIRISDSQMKEIYLKHCTQQPNWNFSIIPSKKVN